MVALAPIVAPASAQALLRLHVRQFSMTAVPASLRVGDTFVLTIVTQVDENVLELDDVTLPDLSGFESLGDERRCATAYRGSSCTEIMTLTPVTPGDHTIAGATLEAIDARNGRATRFASNGVVVHVAGAPTPNIFVQAALEALRLSLMLLAVCAVLYAGLWAWLRRKRAAPEPPAVQALPVAPPPPLPPPLERLVNALAERPTRAAVLAVRRELRATAGASETETLGDLLARNVAGTGKDLRAALRAVEIAAFTSDADLPAAIEQALGPLQALVASRPPLQVAAPAGVAGS